MAKSSASARTNTRSSRSADTQIKNQPGKAAAFPGFFVVTLKTFPSVNHWRGSAFGSPSQRADVDIGPYNPNMRMHPDSPEIHTEFVIPCCMTSPPRRTAEPPPLSGEAWVRAVHALRRESDPPRRYSPFTPYPQKRMAALASSAVGSTKGPGCGRVSAMMGSSVQPRMK